MIPRQRRLLLLYLRAYFRGATHECGSHYRSPPAPARASLTAFLPQLADRVSCFLASAHQAISRRETTQLWACPRVASDLHACLRSSLYNPGSRLCLPRHPGLLGRRAGCDPAGNGLGCLAGWIWPHEVRRLFSRSGVGDELDRYSNEDAGRYPSIFTY